MKAYLIRVGIDQRSCRWNSPINRVTNMFVYVPIPEGQDGGNKLQRQGYAESFSQFERPCSELGKELPTDLLGRDAHLDPDFRYLTYGDQHNKAKQLNDAKLIEDDVLAFYAGLKPIDSPPNETHDLIYALIGLYVLAGPGVRAIDLPPKDWHKNAHTRRVPQDDDIVFFAKEDVSGRLEKCIDIGECIDGRYYLKQDLFDLWGGFEFVHKKKIPRLYLQVSGALPELKNAAKFYDWFKTQNIHLRQRNN